MIPVIAGMKRDARAKVEKMAPNWGKDQCFALRQ